MELTRAYHQLMTYNKKYTYVMKDGQIVFNNGWAWIVVFLRVQKWSIFWHIVKLLTPISKTWDWNKFPILTNFGSLTCRKAGH